MGSTVAAVIAAALHLGHGHVGNSCLTAPRQATILCILLAPTQLQSPPRGCECQDPAAGVVDTVNHARGLAHALRGVPDLPQVAPEAGATLPEVVEVSPDSEGSAAGSTAAPPEGVP